MFTFAQPCKDSLQYIWCNKWCKNRLSFCKVMVGASPQLSSKSTLIKISDLNDKVGESAISLRSYTVPLVQWSTSCFPSWETQVQSPWGYLCETRILLLALSHYIIPLDLKQLFCTGFTLAAGPPSGFTTNIVGCWGGGAVESLQSYCIHIQFHWSSGSPVCFPSWGTRVLIPRGVLMWNRDSPVSVVSLHW